MANPILFPNRVLPCPKDTEQLAFGKNRVTALGGHTDVVISPLSLGVALGS